MITVISYKSSCGYSVSSGFSSKDRYVFKDKAEKAMCDSDIEIRMSMISIEIFDDNGNYQDSDCFASVDAAVKWWSELCYN